MDGMHKRVAAVTSMDGELRYAYFIKTVVDREAAWGLFQNGWAMALTDEGQPVFLLWPKKEYAELCAQGEWSGYEAESIVLDDILEALLPKLRRENAVPGIFFTVAGKGITPSIECLERDLRAEMEKY